MDTYPSGACDNVDEGWRNGRSFCICGDPGCLPIDGDSNGFNVVSDEAPKANDLSGGNAEEVFFTEVLAANMIAITDKINSLEEINSDGSVHSDGSVKEVEEVEKLPGLFGDAESLPIDVEKSEYDVLPDTSPDLWLQRYRFEAVLTGRSKLLHEKAVVAYAKKENVRCAVEVVAVESDASKESEQIDAKKAKWFDKFVGTAVESSSRKCIDSRKEMSKLKRNEMIPSKRGRCRPTNDSRKEMSKLKKNMVVTLPKRGRGQPPKDSRMNTSKLKKNVFITLLKRGRGRPRKDGKETFTKVEANLSVKSTKSCTLNYTKSSTLKRKYSNIEDIKGSTNPKKRGRPPKNLYCEFCVSELCQKCCVKIGKKFVQNIKGKLLRVQIANEKTVSEDGFVKRPRGRPVKVVAGNVA